jgi:hypothetical protein
MEQDNEFESLLRGAVDKFQQTSLPGNTVSEMIDAKLAAGKSNLLATIRKEMMIILSCIGLFIAYFFLAHSVFGNQFSHRVLVVYNWVCVAGMVYCMASLLLFVRLLQISSLQKNTGIRTYVTVLYKKTKRALLVYFWVSVIVTVGMVFAFLISMDKIPLYLSIPVTIVMGTGIYFLNVWYLDKRFGSKLKELQILISEFE